MSEKYTVYESLCTEIKNLEKIVKQPVSNMALGFRKIDAENLLEQKKQQVKELIATSPAHLDKEFTKVIHSTYMNKYLQAFSMKLITAWGEKKFLKTLPEENIRHFDGYTGYYFPDRGHIKEVVELFFGEKDIAYGIAVIEGEGAEHTHVNDSYNKILSGNGVFVGEGSKYDGMPMIPGAEFEIVKHMRHGHRVVDGLLTLFFMQERDATDKHGNHVDFTLVEK